MASDGTVLNGVTTAGGDTIDTELLGSGSKLPRGKIVIGARDVDGGDVQNSNPLPVALYPGGAANSVGNPIFVQSTASQAPTAFYMLGTSSPSASGVAKNAAGTLRSASAYNGSGANAWLQVFNSATAPAANAVPVFQVLLPPGEQVVIGTDFFTDVGWPATLFTAGIAWGLSSVRGSFTAEGTPASFDVFGTVL